jgi:hypothetical protein
VNDSNSITDTLEVDPSLASATLDVNRASLTITADDKQMWQGTVPPPLTATYDGFVYGDTPADLATPLELSTPADNYSPAGEYPIFASGASDPDYDITFVDGIMTVYVDRFIEETGMPVYPPIGLRPCSSINAEQYGRYPCTTGVAYWE